MLRQHGERLITFNINNKEVKIDPNRMFTRHGRIESLKKQNPTISEQSPLITQAEQLAEKLSHFVLASLNGTKPPSTLVAMHNNTNGYTGDGKDGYGDVSIIRYQKNLPAVLII